mmetsp:Transcript_23809/g.57672  ORF Transcript_23809/g.57672 Transcript_23809/m.57672 type:complete len:1737 (+) Transcript_23809:84-5294(+)|eukprot:CAMPEP_0114497790 /NCGR_PEP_ID=MMETSP0109-20121206/6521_1 /TAXON_ID=29199 /ORGANISM="Chlorarachnion reptans, Strain CCCM449" /LENGTH=1736 /DNA_ID=CAMNT_0001675213 /DNA_START=54 /DNA_END=5264 /DNA_ORIENTATION=-
MNQSLLFPLVFWDGPPKHDITAVTAGSQYVVTGALSGELCLWKYTEESDRRHGDWVGRKYLKPCVAMVHEGCVKVTALASINRTWDDLEMIVSGDVKGRLTLWDSSGGRCHFSRKVFRKGISCIRELPAGVSKERDLLACMGMGTNQVHIVDVHTLSTVAILTQKWPLVDIAVAEINNTFVLIALAKAGTLGFWDLKEVVANSEKQQLGNIPGLSSRTSKPKMELRLDQILAPPEAGPGPQQPSPSPAGPPRELRISPSGNLLCVRFGDGYFSLLNVPNLLKYASGAMRRDNKSEKAEARRRCVILRDISLESKEDREIRESEGMNEIDWQGCVFLHEPIPDESVNQNCEYLAPSQKGPGLSIFFYSGDGGTCLVSVDCDGNDTNFRANIETGPLLLRSTLEKGHRRYMPEMSRRALEDLQFQQKHQKDHHSQLIPGWETCSMLRIRAVGVGLSDHLDRTSNSDPYLQVYSGDELLWETEVVHNNPHPHWRDVVLKKESIDPKRPLRFYVFDKEELVDDLIGALEVDLKTLTGMARNCTLALRPVGENGEILPVEDHSEVKENDTSIGSIRFKAVELEDDDDSDTSNSFATSPLTKVSGQGRLGLKAEPILEEEDEQKAKQRDDEKELDDFKKAAGSSRGRPRGLEITANGEGNVMPVKCCSDGGVVIVAGGTGLVQLWIACPTPPKKYRGLEIQKRRDLRLSVVQGQARQEVAEANGFMHYIKNRMEKVTGSKVDAKIQEGVWRVFEEQRGLMSPVFWIGDAFEALQSNPCTASVLAAGGGDKSDIALLLARGYQKGGIVAASLLDGQNHVTFQGHRAEVTCIVAVPPEQSPTGTSLLVSGGLDGCLCVWDIDKKDRLGRFRCRSPVLSLHWPQTNRGDRQIPGDLVMAVTADNAVHIVSLSELDTVQVLQGHDSRVVVIYRNWWAVQADYIVTQTLSGTTYVWSLTTGHLDRMMDRKSAYNFLVSRGLLEAGVESTFLQASGSEAGSMLTSSSTSARPADLNSPTKMPYGDVVTAPSPEISALQMSPALTALSAGGMSASNLLEPRAVVDDNSKMDRAKSAQISQRGSKNGGNAVNLSSRRFSIRDAKKDFVSPQNTKRRGTTGMLSPNSQPRPTSDPLMQVCNMGRAGGVLRANMFCININRLITELRTQYRHLSTRTGAEGAGGTRILRAVLSYLFEWGVDESLDKILKEQFGFRRPYPNPAFGVMSYRSKAVALLLPGASKANSRWELCPTLTAIHSLSLSALCMTMLSTSHPSKQVYYTQIVSHYGVHLPDHLKTYVEPSVEVLVVFSYNQTEEIHMASRLLLQGVIERSNLPTLRKIVERWTSPEYFSPKKTDIGVFAASRQLLYSGGKMGGSLSPFFETPVLSNDPSMDRRLIAALVLCLIAADQQRKRQKNRGRQRLGDAKVDSKDGVNEAIRLTSGVVSQITETLRKVIFDVASRHAEQPNATLSPQDIVVSSLAAELMGKGFFLWRRHITDVASLISKLHRLSLIKRAALAGAAHRALLQAGQAAPRSFIRQMGNEALNLKSKSRCRSGALFAIVALVKKYPSSLVTALPSAVQIIIKCLDPSAPALRKSLLRPATAALHALVQNYPSVTFHQKSQRFAVGTSPRTSSVIVIYDLRTATKWRILSGHKKTITAVSFNPSATYLASYSPDESPPCLKFWETGSQGFLTNFLGIQGQCVKTIPLKVVSVQPGSQTTSEALLNNRIVWISPKMVKLRREDGTVTNYGI